MKRPYTAARTHGLTGTYAVGCRCDDCRLAWNAYRRVAQKATNRALARLKQAHKREFARYYKQEGIALGVRVGQPGRPKA